MKLTSLSVSNYRSITQARKIDLRESTILIGPNNEGKSNILRALVLALSTLSGQRHRSLRRRPSYRRTDERYDWQRDFPLHLQEKKPTGESKFTLEFALTPDEIDEFRKEVKSSLNGNLPIQLSFGPEKIAFKVAKRGRGGKALSKKVDPITAFVAQRLDFEYIPAVRTAASAEEVVERIVAYELRQVEADPAFRDALNAIARLQKPVLDKVSESIRDTLRVFLPAVNDVSVSISDEDRYRALRRDISITVDDGTPTLLQHKGDGVQSLAALSLMRYSSISGARGRNLVIAIEEPESHLHPDAIHSLRGVLRDIARKHQLAITTHCPVFVDRARIGNNIIVHNKKAVPAKTVSEIRDVLGVRASDNLRHAELVLLVEGDDDRQSLTALICEQSKQLATAINDGTLAIEPIGGAGNLSYKASEIINALCAAHCFLDHDRPGIAAAEKAKVDGVLSGGDITFALCDGLKESEFEDLLDSSIYKAAIKNKWRVDIANKKFRGKKKWSDRMGDVFKVHGKPWTDALKGEVKMAVANVVKRTPSQALHVAKRGPVDALVSALEDRLGEIPS